MYCPRCGQEQITGDMRFCSSCGFQLEAVAGLLSGGEISQPLVETAQENASLPHKSPRLGLKLIFFSVVVLPLIFIASYFFDSPVPFTIPALVFLTGLSQTAYIYLFGEKAEPASEKILSAPLAPASELSSDINTLIAKLNRELQQTDGFSSLVIEGLMLELIAETSRNYVKADEPVRPAWLREIEEILQNQFSDNLTLADIARSADVHPTHLARVFRQYHGCTVGEYIRNLRIEHSCLKLTSTGSSLADIALEAGFYDQSHFSRCFKQIKGLTPTEYRIAHQIR